MKKIFTFIFLLLTVFCLTSCDEKLVDNNQNNNENNNNNNQNDEIKEYSITFHVNSNTIDTVVKNIKSNEKITFNYLSTNVYNNEVPIKDNYEYLNEWYYDSEYLNKVTLPLYPTKDMDLYLKWDRNPIEYEVKYYIDGVKKFSHKQWDTELINKPEDPVKIGYTFEGWYTDKKFTNKFDFLSYIDSDIKLYANFTHNDFKFDDVSKEIKTSLGDTGYINKDKLPNFSDYVNTSYYAEVTNVSELLNAIKNAQLEYTSTWEYTPRTEEETTKVNRLNELNEKRANNTITKEENTERVAIENELDSAGTPGKVIQNLTKDSKIHVIEIKNDINLGYNHLSTTDIATGVVDNFSAKNTGSLKNFNMSDFFTENGISQVKIQNTNNLLIYSKNGSKLTCGGFKLTSCSNIVFRNLEFDELWQWEDTSNINITAVGDYDAFGWAYFKISFSENIWIDHCTFGKSYDGQIDYSNPYYTNRPTAFRAPYQGTGGNGLHISWCKFNSGSANEDGYLYKMMEKIEQEYLDGQENYLYYNALRDNGYSFEQILYGLAIPQKKGFLLGDSGDEFTYNYEINVSFANCYFKNIEDRLPKIRGGHVYMYDCVVDSLEYYGYRQILKEAPAKNKLTATGAILAVNSSWKCALVSQGILSGLGASITAENCIFRGIEYILKNNDSSLKNELKNPNATLKGGYKIINCSYQKSSDSDIITSNFPNTSGSSSLSEDFFNWHTENNTKPFEINVFELEKLEDYLLNPNYGVGSTPYMENNWIIFTY